MVTLIAGQNELNITMNISPPPVIGSGLIESAVASPNPARPGDMVTVNVTVRQLLLDGLVPITVTADQPPSGLPMLPTSKQLGFNEPFTFVGSFTMPNWGIAPDIQAYYWGGEKWIPFGKAKINIDLQPPPPIISPSGSTRTKIIVQDYAVVDEIVPIQIVVENISPGDIFISTTLTINYGVEVFMESYSGIISPAGYVFTTSFKMPDVTPTEAAPNVYVQIAGYTTIYDTTRDAQGLLPINPRTDSLSVGRQVRVMPPSPQFSVRIKNAPPFSFIWLFQYAYGYAGVWPQSGGLVPSSTWYSPYPAPNIEVPFEMYVYDNVSNTLHQKTGRVIIGTGKKYVYDCTTKTLTAT